MSRWDAESMRQRMANALSANALGHAAKLLGTNLLAQLITLAMIPVLTRIYPPADYAILAGLMAVVMIGSLMAALGFDYAIAVEPDDRQANCLTLLACGAALFVSALILVASLLAQTQMLHPLLGTETSATMPWLLAVAIFAASLSTTFEALQVRYKQFGIVGWARVAQATLGLGAQILFGLNGEGERGLVLGYFVFMSVPAAIHCAHLLRTGRLYKAKSSELLNSARINRRYVFFTAPEALLNAASVHGPILLIATMSADPVMAAHISMSMRLLQAPSFLVAKIASQLLQGSIRQWESTGEVSVRSKALLRTLLFASVIAGTPAAILAPAVAPWLLGTAWADIGWVLSILLPGVLLHMVSFPLIPVAYLNKRNARLMQITAGAALLRVSLAVAFIDHAGLAVAIAFGSGALLQYAVLTMFLYRVSQQPVTQESS
jgi:O-antigen/teichoic acid export membrane protein